jgi:cobalt-zinc-cadmium efflux system membrane fusion protein
MLSKRHLIIVTAILVLAGSVYVYREAGHDHGGPHDSKEQGHAEADGEGAHGEHAEEQFERGPHNGRLLKEDDFAVEVTIFEDNVPPRFHLYVTDDGEPVPPETVTLTAELTRLGGKVDRFTFTPEGDYLAGSDIVKEPHSFDVAITATYEDKRYHWKYASYEGRTKITPAAAAAAGIETLQSGPAKIQETVMLNGSIVLDPNKTAQIKARFPGIVREVKKNLGDTVKVGDVLATVEANDSLQVYPVKSPLNGVILTRNTNAEDVASDAPLFVVADLSNVWAEFHVFHRDLSKVKIGNPVTVYCAEDDTKGTGTVMAFLPLAESVSQTMVARVHLDNTEGHWHAGMNLTGKVVSAEHEVPLAVKASAIQRFRNFDVVFAKIEDIYEARMLELGTNDGEWAEVQGGIEPGETYVSKNSFLVKADIEKSGASHDH